MIGIRINGGFLDLFPGTRLTFEFNNMALMATDSDDIIPTSYSFPVDIPLSENNKDLIGHPEVIENTATLLKDHPCQIYAGNFLWNGKITIRNALRSGRASRARMYIIINPAADLQDFSLIDVDYGGDIDISSPSPTGHAKATTTSPLNQGYIFFPVYNPKFFLGDDDDPGTHTSKFQNYYNVSSQTFTDAADQQNAMPFIRVEHLLQKIFDHIGVPLVNNWMSTDELRKLCLYNNHSIYTAAGWPDAIDLVNHVPDMPANEFVRKLLQLFGIGLFNDPFDFSVTLEPMRDLIGGEHKHDWTAKAAAQYEISGPGDVFGIFCHGADENDESFELYTGPPLLVAGEVDSIGDIPNDGLPYYVIDQNGYYAVVGATLVFVGKEYFQQDTGLSTEKFTNELAPLFMAPQFLTTGAGGAGETWFMPIIHNGGKHDVYGMDYDFAARLMFYRGIIQTTSGSDYPFANNQAWNPYGNLTWNNSLLWTRDNNIYDTWLSELINMTHNQKEVKMDLNLHMRDILNFKFQDKVRIRNMNYFVKKLRITFSGSRITTEGTLVTTL